MFSGRKHGLTLQTVLLVKEFGGVILCATKKQAEQLEKQYGVKTKVLKKGLTGKKIKSIIIDEN